MIGSASGLKENAPAASYSAEGLRNDPKSSTEMRAHRRKAHAENLGLQVRRRNTRTPHGPAPALEVDKPLQERISTFKTRAMWSLVLVFSFLLILAAGHFYASLLVMILTGLVYREIIALKRNVEKDKKLPLFFIMRWYWFLLTIYGTGYSRIIPLAESLHIPSNHYWLGILVSHHLIITYLFGFLGLILFVLSLRRYTLKYQFSQLAILVLTCLFVVGQCLVYIGIICDGLIWFIISSSSVIVNDCFAYIIGALMGRTRLIKLSPKKTLEGYLGASIITLAWSVFISTRLSHSPALTCSLTKFDLRPFSMWRTLSCEVYSVFKTQSVSLPSVLRHLTGTQTIRIKPATLHGLMLGIFAAFFAPFGGFFASALKRSLKIKDFGESIPGHGGITDRFDCQVFMAMFTFLYVRTFVFRSLRKPTVGYILHLLTRLTPEEKVTVELKNDVQISGTLNSVDQYMNVKINNVTVNDPDRYPHLLSIKNCFIRGSVVRYIHMNPTDVDTELLQDFCRKESQQQHQQSGGHDKPKRKG